MEKLLLINQINVWIKKNFHLVIHQKNLHLFWFLERYREASCQAFLKNDLVSF